MSTGLSAMSMYTKTARDPSKLSELHVWGCPVYVLEPKLQDGKKLPKWNTKSRRGVYMGLSTRHASSVGVIYNPVTF